MSRAWNAVLPALVSLLLVLACWLGVGIAPAQAYDNPDLLPDHPTPVIDLAKALTDGQRISLEENLTRFEADTGWKLRVLTQYDRTPGQAVKDFWTNAACCWWPTSAAATCSTSTWVMPCLP